jgi:regulator of replication initiation timing
MHLADSARASKNQAAMSALHERIRDLTSQNHSLLMQNRRLTERMQQLQEENNYLIKNAEEEITKMSDFIDRYTER